MGGVVNSYVITRTNNKYVAAEYLTFRPDTSVGINTASVLTFVWGLFGDVWELLGGCFGGACRFVEGLAPTHPPLPQ